MKISMLRSIYWRTMTKYCATLQRNEELKRIGM